MRGRLLRCTTALVAAVVLAACGGAVSDEHERDEPYTLESIPGEPFPRVVLEESAVVRLGIETAQVGARGVLLTVPAEAVYLDADGTFWVYTNPEPNTYLRHVVDLVRETSTTAFLAEGPLPGTEVVTVGIPELYGAETGFGT